jgi:hypothetical protein
MVCGGARGKLTGIWDDGTRAAVAAAFRATGQPYAEDSLERVTGRLDAWADRWSASHTEACEATAVRHEQSAAALDLRMRCLDRQRLETAALVDTFRAPTATGVENASTAVARLADVASCADVERLALAAPLPADPARVQTLQAELARATARWSVGERGPLREELRRIAVAARDLDYPPLAARAWLQLAVAEAEHDLKTGVVEAREAVRLAARARDDAAAARAWYVILDASGRLTWLTAGTQDVAMAFAAYDAAVERAGGAPLDRAQALLARATTTSTSRGCRWRSGAPRWRWRCASPCWGRCTRTSPPCSCPCRSGRAPPGSRDRR